MQSLVFFFWGGGGGGGYWHMAKLQGRVVTNVIAFMKFLYKFLMYARRLFFV